MRTYVIPYPNRVVDVAAAFDLSEEEGIAAVASGWTTGATIGLPGPGTGHNPPNNGDTYAIADPQGRITGGVTLVVNGGGYKFLAVQGSAVGLHLTATFGALTFTAGGGEGTFGCSATLRFVFDAAGQVWIVL